MTPDITCPPYDFGRDCHLPAGATILELASRASDAANRYRDVMERRANFRDTMRAARYLADATDALTTAIADAVACGDNRLS